MQIPMMIQSARRGFSALTPIARALIAPALITPALVIPALLSLALATSTSAQEAHSTLARLVDGSMVVAQVRVLQARDDGLQRRVTFKVQQTLKGQLEPSFELSETSRHACGSALHGTLVGASFLAFLDSKARRHQLSVASSRALIPLTPEILRHVRGLLTRTSVRQRLSLVVAGLTSAQARIREDAAATLLRSRHLEQLSHSERWHCLRALERSLGREDRVALNLLAVTSRLHLHEAVDVLVPRYLSRQTGRLDPVILTTLAQLDTDRAVRILEQAMPKDLRGLQRGITLLGSCQGAAANRCLDTLSRHDNRVVASLAQRTRTTAGRAVDESASRHPRFRSILQHRHQ